eukprot:m.330690 g.330690  ORF g.330690 m.330690 type:complete len:339 (+) comp16049_c0_seq20:1089-2105(+)
MLARTNTVCDTNPLSPSFSVPKCPKHRSLLLNMATPTFQTDSKTNPEVDKKGLYQTAEEVEASQSEHTDRKVCDAPSEVGSSLVDDAGHGETAAHGEESDCSAAEKRFKCGECGKSYARREHLSRHKRSHKPFAKWLKCEFCPRRFYRRDHLNYHLTTHPEAIMSSEPSLATPSASCQQQSTITAALLQQAQQSASAMLAMQSSLSPSLAPQAAMFNFPFHQQLLSPATNPSLGHTSGMAPLLQQMAPQMPHPMPTPLQMPFRLPQTSYALSPMTPMPFTPSQLHLATTMFGSTVQTTRPQLRQPLAFSQASASPQQAEAAHQLQDTAYLQPKQRKHR